MNVSLTPQLETLLKEKVATGMYGSVSEVVREALRLLSERDSIQEIKREALKAAIVQGFDSLENGKGQPLDIESIKAKGRHMLAARKS
ncbi:MAG: type II toxin-antitoxin system ParD family antitoxin [Pseudomonadota bacterium]